MSNKWKYLYCEDTFNTLGNEGHQFQSSQAYKWYLSLLPGEELNKVWNSYIGLDGCVPEVTKFKERVL